MKRGFWLMVLILAACSQATTLPTPTTSSSTAALTQTTNSPEPTSDAETVVVPNPVFQRPTYTLIATLDYNAHYLRVTEQIIYTNNSTDKLEEIPLIVAADDQNVFSLISLESDHDTKKTDEPDQAIYLTLTNPLNPGEQMTIDLEYSLSIPQAASTLGWTERQTNFVDWYPFIPPYVDGGWLINQPSTQGEYLAYESADFKVEINLINAPALMQIAAPAPAIETKNGGFAYQLESARRFSWSTGGHYQTESRTTNDGIPVTIYFFEEERGAAKASLETAAKAIDVYSELFGPYPYKTLSIVECTFSDGMESDGLFFLDMSYFRGYNYKTTNLLMTLSAHETAHNWWYGAVGNDPANEPWLDEALATYSERLFYENTYPNDVAWWWNFRVKDLNPTGLVDSSVYDLPNFRPYVNAVYLRGAQFLEELRPEIGEENFEILLRRYLVEGSGKIMATRDFFKLLKEISPNDLSTLIAKYFQSSY